jgi:hypothetical protein
MLLREVVVVSHLLLRGARTQQLVVGVRHDHVAPGGRLIVIKDHGVRVVDRPTSRRLLESSFVARVSLHQLVEVDHILVMLRVVSRASSVHDVAIAAAHIAAIVEVAQLVLDRLRTRGQDNLTLVDRGQARVERAHRLHPAGSSHLAATHDLEIRLDRDYVTNLMCLSTRGSMRLRPLWY